MIQTAFIIHLKRRTLDVTMSNQNAMKILILSTIKTHRVKSYYEKNSNVDL